MIVFLAMLILSGFMARDSIVVFPPQLMNAAAIIKQSDSANTVLNPVFIFILPSYHAVN
jgi:hypothetical protein